MKPGGKSRAKGKRVEYEIRDYFRAQGFKADRVPSSGAAQGFKGDVRVEGSDNDVFTVEVKARKSGFKRLYAFLENTEGLHASYAGLSICVAFHFTDLIWISNTPSAKLEPEYLSKGPKAVFDSLARMHAWVKGCDYLVIKGDRMPPLFIEYRVLNGPKPGQDQVPESRA